MSVSDILSGVAIPSAELARILQVSDGHIADLKSGRRKPSIRLAKKIEEATGRKGLVEAVVRAKMLERAA